MAGKNPEKIASIPEGFEILQIKETVLKSFQVGKDGKTIGEIAKHFGIDIKFLQDDLAFNTVMAINKHGKMVEYSFGEPRLEDLYALKRNSIHGTYYLSRTRGNQTYTIELPEHVLKKTSSVDNTIRDQVFGLLEETETA